MTIGKWDIALLVATTMQIAIVAYLYHPRWKALASTIPVPFTLATLAINRPLDAKNILGLAMLYLFVIAVRWLYYGLKLPIVFAIVLACIGYGVAGWGLSRHVPGDDRTFYIAAAGLMAMAIFMLMRSASIVEPGHRTPLPVYVKAPGVGLIVMGLILLKGILTSFISTFPMVTSFATYEARHSLRTLSRQVPIIILAAVPMMAVCRAVQSHWGLKAGLALGWLAFLTILTSILYLTRHRHVIHHPPAEAEEEEETILPPAPAGS